ncbi:tRNA pseudouridine(54/55) synthase Pus10 [Nitrososphaera sp.]|uniref:tRNA pseudouridine(54/55) synthase Pus10 n=1 Tax=Nitrososphaera sp. TaxID=1971748 RepID=UPI00307F3D0C
MVEGRPIPAAKRNRRAAALLLKEYSLCRRCLARQGATTATATTTTATGSKNKSLPDGDTSSCYICRGLMGRLDELAKKAFAATKGYQYDTFLVGATLATQFYEREDALRARLKIRGRESIKGQLTRELGARLAKITGKKADYVRPDVSVNVTIDREGATTTADVSVRARPLVIEGRYTKKSRGLPQKQDRCPMCLGKGGAGCNLCEGTGLSGFDSIEGLIARQLVKSTGGQAPKFSWVGSEDRESLVLGKGRPFYAKISDPKVRRPNKPLRLGDEAAKSGAVQARIIKILDDLPDVPPRFATKTQIAVRCARPVTTGDLKKLKRSLAAGAQVKFQSRDKLATKRIIRPAQVKKTGENEFLLTLYADGGLPIKQFVGGEEYMEPNVSGILEARCECATFDVLTVDLLQ